MSRTLSTLTALVAAVALSGCTVKKTEAPSLSGPSEFGLSIRTTVSPDLVKQDGFAESQVEIVARGPDGRPQGGISLRVDLTVGGVIMDFGRLSSRVVTTGSDGIARLTYTAPPAPAERVDNFTIVTLYVTPINGDYANANSRSVEIRVVPPDGTILPPNNPPVPAFVVTPTPVTTYTPVTLDATGTTDEGQPCGSACLYSWDFGDGSAATGQVVGHEFRTAGSFTVRLTVTDIRGRTATTAQVVAVTQTPRPTAAFTFSPSEPLFDDPIFFNAAASTAAPGHRLVAYDWDFGSGRTGSGMTVSKTYGLDLIPAGSGTGDTVTFNVTLTVHDDTFQPTGVGVVTQPVRVRVP
ncbi:MAG: PKD domain-containing protein [Vicinamibacterales bacterium]